MKKLLPLIMVMSLVGLPFGIPDLQAAGIGKAVGKGIFRGIAKKTPVIPSRLFHATENPKTASQILKKGFDPRKMNSKARLGRGVYFGESRSAVFREVPSYKAVVGVKPSSQIDRKIVWDLRDPKASTLHSILPSESLRGDIKRSVIGPSLGGKLGRVAGKEGKVVAYRSGQNPKADSWFVPKEVLEKHPKFFQPVSVSGVQHPY